MKIIKPYFEVYENLPDPAYTEWILFKLDKIGRTCYKSEASDDSESAGRFVRKLIEHGHEAMLEHVSISVKFVVDRGVSHELVRHRMASFAQESTRYCNYSKDKFGNELTFIEPCFWSDTYPSNTWHLMNQWKLDMEMFEEKYMQMIKQGAKPEEARAVLPNSLKTEIWMTCNLREWRHVLKLRAAGTTGKPHPQMAEVMIQLLKYMKQYLPDVFFDIEVPHD